MLTSDLTKLPGTWQIHTVYAQPQITNAWKRCLKRSLKVKVNIVGEISEYNVYCFLNKN